MPFLALRPSLLGVILEVDQIFKDPERIVVVANGLI